MTEQLIYIAVMAVITYLIRVLPICLLYTSDAADE